MKRTQSIQRSKLITSYGGVGSIIDTIDNIAYIIEPFDRWNIYNAYYRNTQQIRNYLTTTDERLKTRLRNIGFNNLENFFLTDDNFDGVNVNLPHNSHINRMVTAKYAPRWFYCEKCGELRDIEEWRRIWKKEHNNEMSEPRCVHCSRRPNNDRIFAPKLKQVRFVLASLENGELIDLPWSRLYKAKNGSLNFRTQTGGAVTRVWDFSNLNKIESKYVSYHIKKGGSDLIDIYIKSGEIYLTMAEVMNHYFIMEDGHVYKPVIRSANNVYFPFNMSSLYVPRHIITTQEFEKILRGKDRGWDVDGIYDSVDKKVSKSDIQYIIDHNVAPNPDYMTEEEFRMDEFDYITNADNYNSDGILVSEDKRLITCKYKWENERPSFIKDIYLLKHIEITSVQVAYSRLEPVSSPNFNTMTGNSRKQWFNKEEGIFMNSGYERNEDVRVGLHLTCRMSKDKVSFMPAVLSRGEGFFVELDLSSISDNLETFTHTYAHLVMKELEFSCGYPLPSMNERLYKLPKEITNADRDKYGFIIYSANGEAGSYGGISSLFENKNIENILNNAILLADDCPNDPICESEGANCFACVQIPETACELFNMSLNRKIFKDICRSSFSMFNETSENIDSNMKEDANIIPSVDSNGIKPGIILG